MNPDLTISFRSAALLHWKSVHPLDLSFRFILLDVGRYDVLERIYIYTYIPLRTRAEHTSGHHCPQEEVYRNVFLSCHPPDVVHKRRDDGSCRGLFGRVDGIYQRMDPTLNNSLSADDRAFFECPATATCNSSC